LFFNGINQIHTHVVVSISYRAVKWLKEVANRH
jgi:hypothetical protein